MSGMTITAPGSHGTPTMGEYGLPPQVEVQLGALFCLGPTDSVAINNAAGLPGLGRMTMGAFLRALPSPDRTTLGPGGTTGGVGVGGP